jgi:Sugar (and other) transporter
VPQHFQLQHSSAEARWLEKISNDGLWLLNSDDKTNAAIIPLSSLAIFYIARWSYFLSCTGHHMFLDGAIELLFVIVGGLALALSPPPISEPLICYIIPLVVLMGVSLGSDYPLSSVITREFDTIKWRGATRAAAFTIHGISGLVSTGDLVATTFIACTCIYAPSTENIWRTIIGVAAIPAGFAIYLRLAIPESPRYSLDIYPNFNTAAKPGKDYRVQWPEMGYLHALVEVIAIYHSIEEINMREGRSPALIPTIPRRTTQLKGFTPHQSVRLPGSRHSPRLAFSNKHARFLSAATCWYLLDRVFYGVAFGNARVFDMTDRASDFKIRQVIGNRNAFNFARKYSIMASYILYPIDQLRRWARYQWVPLSAIFDAFISAVMANGVSIPFTRCVSRLRLAI